MQIPKVGKILLLLSIQIFPSLGYVVTVQFLMTFNFVMMNILLILLIIDYIISRQPSKSGSVLIRKYNTADTALIYGLLLYVLYVLSKKIVL